MTYCRIVDREKGQPVAIVNPHWLRVCLKEQPIAKFGVQQLLFNLLPSSNVPSNRLQFDDFPVLDYQLYFLANPYLACVSGHCRKFKVGKRDLGFHLLPIAPFSQLPIVIPDQLEEV